MWGFLTSLNDILVPHLKSIFDLDDARAMLVQFAFFSAYFLFSLPWARSVNKIGYHRTMPVRLKNTRKEVVDEMARPAGSGYPYPDPIGSTEDLDYVFGKERVANASGNQPHRATATPQNEDESHSDHRAEVAQ